MRTTLTLDLDVAVEVDRLRRVEGIGVSEAVNRLARAGMSRPAKRSTYRHRSVDLGLRGDVSNVAEVLELLDER